MKLNNIKIAALLTGTVFMMTACSQEEIDLYSGPTAGIFIQQVRNSDIYGNPLSYQDGQTGITFATQAATVKGLVTSFVVRSIGPVTDYDRPYDLKIVPEETTAVEGVDYTLEGNEFCIKAGESTDKVTINMIRHSGLLQKTVRVYFKLSPNEHFDMPVTEYKNSSNWTVAGDTLKTDHYYIEFGENYTCPSYWNNFGKSYFGDWTVNKYLTLNDQMGWTVPDWSYAGFSGYKIALGKFGAAAKMLQSYLQGQADAGTPVLDPDDPSGYMQLAANYLVDYGAYLTPQD